MLKRLFTSYDTPSRGGRFLFLLISIFLMMALRPFVPGLVGVGFLMELFFSILLFSGLYAVSQKKSVLITASLLALPVFFAPWVGHLFKVSSFPVIGRIFGALFFAYTAIIILSYLFTERDVTTDVIMAAICAYFLIGIMWAFVFFLMEHFQPGSFRISPGLSPEIDSFIYFSFVTQTTLGYGDFSPVSAPARSLSVLAAIVGQLYIAILIARLVGIHITKSSNK